MDEPGVIGCAAETREMAVLSNRRRPYAQTPMRRRSVNSRLAAASKSNSCDAGTSRSPQVISTVTPEPVPLGDAWHLVVQRARDQQDDRSGDVAERDLVPCVGEDGVDGPAEQHRG